MGAMTPPPYEVFRQVIATAAIPEQDENDEDSPADRAGRVRLMAGGFRGAPRSLHLGRVVAAADKLGGDRLARISVAVVADVVADRVARFGHRRVSYRSMGTGTGIR